MALSQAAALESMALAMAFRRCACNHHTNFTIDFGKYITYTNYTLTFVRLIMKHILSKFKIRLFREYPCLFDRLIFFGLVIMQDSITAPIGTKIQGSYLPVVVISTLATIYVAAGLLQPVMRNVPTKAVCVIAVCSDVLAGVGTVAYLVVPDEYLGAYSYIILTSTSSFIGVLGYAAYRIRIQDMIRQKYGDQFKEFTISVDFVVSLAGLIGGGIAILLGSIGGIRLQAIGSLILIAPYLYFYIRQIKYLLDMEEEFNE